MTPSCPKCEQPMRLVEINRNVAFQFGMGWLVPSGAYALVGRESKVFECLTDGEIVEQ